MALAVVVAGTLEDAVLDEAAITSVEPALLEEAALAVAEIGAITVGADADAFVTVMSASGCAWRRSRNATRTMTTVASANATPTMPLRNRVARASGVEIVVFIGDDGERLSTVVSTVELSTSTEPGSVTSRMTAGFGGRVSWPFSSARGGAAYAAPSAPFDSVETTRATRNSPWRSSRAKSGSAPS